MTSYVLEWIELLARWFHFVVGAAWIGTSFYFNWLNNSVRHVPDRTDGVGGELWAIHGGAFYQVPKYKGAPERLPEVLHWFKWEAYLTCQRRELLFLVYYLGGQGTLPSNTSLRRGKGLFSDWAFPAAGFFTINFASRPQINAKSLGCSRSATPFTHRIRIDPRLYSASSLSTRRGTHWHVHGGQRIFRH